MPNVGRMNMADYEAAEHKEQIHAAVAGTDDLPERGKADLRAENDPSMKKDHQERGDSSYHLQRLQLLHRIRCIKTL